MKKYSSKEAYYSRMRNLANIKESVNDKKDINLGSLVDFKKANDNIVYGIVKENHNYYIKKSDKNENLCVEDFSYINGVENISDYKYKTLAEADKNRNMLILNINESITSPKNTKKEVITEGEEEKNEVNEDAEEELQNAEEKLKDAEVQSDTEEEIPDVTDIDVPEDDSTEDKIEPEKVGDEEIPTDTEEPIDDVSADDEESTEEPTDDETDIEVDDETDDESSEDTDENNKEIQKMVGKVTNKIRATQMTDSQVKSYLNSFISSFEHKLKDLDIEDRKDISNRIMKVIPDSEQDLENSDEMQEAKTCNECGFAKYVESRGYDAESLMECDDDELASLMTGYVMDKEDVDDEDYASMAMLASPEVGEKITNDYGDDELYENMQPFMEKLNEVEDTDKKSKVDGMFWWKVDPKKTKALTEEEDYDDEQGDVPGEQDTGPDEYDEEIENKEEFVEYANKILKNAHGEDFDETKAEYFIDSLIKIATKDEEENWGEAIGILQQSLDEGMGSKDPANVDAQWFENGTEEIDNEEMTDIETEVPVVEPIIDTEESSDSKVDVNVDAQNKTINVTMNESEKTLRKYVQKRLEEKIKGKKSSINENKKSKNLKMLDKMIDEQLEMMLKENKEMNEIFGSSNIDKFNKLDPNDTAAIENLFNKVFGQALKMGARRAHAEKMSPETKYDLLKQGVEKDKLKNPSFGSKGDEYFYVPLKTQNPFKHGGTGGKTSMGGV